MRKTYLITMATLLAATIAKAQSWEIQVGAGIGAARLTPRMLSTPQSSELRYGLTDGGVYASPELHFAANDHHHFTFGYQYAINGVGVQYRSGFNGNNHDEIQDAFDLHNISVGYQYHRLIFNQRLHVSAFAKMGIGYGYGVGSGASAGAGSDGNLTYFVLTQEGRITNGFWTPTSTAGVSIGPNFKGRRMADRLTFQVSMTNCWKNIYSDYSKVSYALTDRLGQVHKGSIQYQGAPLLIQTGINYNVFRFCKK